jgi:hypothetical protein
MDYLAQLKVDLDKGYSKSDLERLIGLPRNSLKGTLKGQKKLSKKSEKRIELWEASEKPDPLKLHFVKKQVKENNQPENKERILEERNKVPDKPKTENPLTENEVKKESAVEKMLRENREKFSKQYKKQ